MSTHRSDPLGEDSGVIEYTWHWSVERHHYQTDRRRLYGSDVTVKAQARSLSENPESFMAKAEIKAPDGKHLKVLTKAFHLGAKESATVELPAKIQDPQVCPRTSFGIRSVSSELNPHNEISSKMNSYPIQMRGGGYATDVFLRWAPQRFECIARCVLDMGMNAIRLEAAMMQTNPSLIAFLVGGDFWSDDRATVIHLDGLHDAEWQVPVISSAAKRGYPKALGPSGLKKEGPYDWVLPVYWFDREPTDNRSGSSFGFGSDLGAGVGTPTQRSLQVSDGQRYEGLVDEAKQGPLSHATEYLTIKDVGVLHLLLVDDDREKVLSRNAYWLSRQKDVVDWTTTSWYSVDVKQSANFTALNTMEQATITASAFKNKTSGGWKLQVENNATVPAVFVQLNLAGKRGNNITPFTWSHNYFTMLPREFIVVKLTDWSGKGAII
ncbi:hypothetical protein FGADI_10250 [Fusarium gaditjirri]|uniref:Exo-beta-D-glucosaminidase Ig-fold domain-containing protein n=1 Tax=Fusarium gaditjirri TaxID=282569 RepID=A0A8H4SXU1_9HYPO|nr:hypothetical protein FGADI_10250 [Fusarium gaditjirri]